MGLEEKLLDLDKLSQVSPRLWVSGSKAAQRLTDLRFGAVVNCTEDDYQYPQSRPDLVLYRMSVPDGPAIETWRILPALVLVMQVLSDTTDHVLVHCHVGMSRSPSIAGAALWATGEGKSPGDILLALQRVRPIVSPQPAVWASCIEAANLLR